MKKILFVEDDAVITRVYGQKLSKAGFDVAVAEDGLAAIRKLPEFSPELVVLDLMMPKLSGVDVLKFMRQEARFRSVRVIVFSNALHHNSFGEQAASFGIDRALVKASVSPKQLVEIVETVLAGQPPEIVSSEAVMVAASTVEEFNTALTRNNVAEYSERVRRDFFERAPVISQNLRTNCQKFVEARDPMGQLKTLGELNRTIGFLMEMCRMARCHRMGQLVRALEVLLFELQEGGSITDSCRHTVVSTIVFLTECLARADQGDEQSLSPTTVLLMCDHAGTTRALMFACDRVKVTCHGVADPVEAIQALKLGFYDAVILDVNRPEGETMAICEHIHTLPMHKLTPVIIVASGAFQWSQALVMGGDDVVQKPIRPTELCVRVIMQILKHRFLISNSVASNS